MKFTDWKYYREFLQEVRDAGIMFDETKVLMSILKGGERDSRSYDIACDWGYSGEAGLLMQKLYMGDRFSWEKDLSQVILTKENKMNNSQKMEETVNQIKVLEEIKADLQKKIDEASPRKLLGDKRVRIANKEQLAHMREIFKDLDDYNSERSFSDCGYYYFIDSNDNQRYGGAVLRIISYSEACELLGVDEVVPKLEKGDKVRFRNYEPQIWQNGFFLREDLGRQYTQRVVHASNNNEESFNCCEAYDWVEMTQRQLFNAKY